MPTSKQLLQALADGLMVGSLYALVAFSFSLLWAAVRTINLSLLQVGAVAGTVTYGLSAHGALVAIFGGVLAGTAVGVLSHFIAIRPLLNRWSLVPIIASLAVGLLIRSGLSSLFGDDARRLPAFLPSGVFDIGGVFVRKTGTIVLAVTVILVVAYVLVAARSRIGLAFRATSWAPDTAAANGVDVDRVRLGAAIAASAVIGLAGVLTGLVAGSVSPYSGETGGLKGLVAMLVGGAGNGVGALVAGLLIGVLESTSELFVSSSMKSVVSFGLLLAVMVARPTGLLKER